MSGIGIDVLLIEDDSDDAKRVQESLAASPRPPIRVDREERLDAGLRRLSERDYDAVLLALGLADDGGLDAYLRVRDAFPDVAVVVLTRSGNEVLGSKAVDLGASDALAKDASLADGLPRRLRYAVERHKLRLELKGLDMLDDLTGLYNRRGFVALATPVLKVARRMRSGVLLVVAAVEGDRWSAPAEEARAVRAAGNLLRDTFRDSDLAARVGRDDFAVLAVNANDGTIISQRLRDKLVEHNRCRGAGRRSLEVGCGRGSNGDRISGSGSAEGTKEGGSLRSGGNSTAFCRFRELHGFEAPEGKP
jgi:diguanylate cyclase (GGDEF)-like protein